MSIQKRRWRCRRDHLDSCFDPLKVYSLAELVNLAEQKIPKRELHGRLRKLVPRIWGLRNRASIRHWRQRRLRKVNAATFSLHRPTINR